MTVTTLIDQIVERVENANEADVNLTEKRQRVLDFLIEVFAYVWYAKSWSFKVRESTIALAAQGENVIAPSDFSESVRGGLFSPTTYRRLRQVSPWELIDARERNPSGVSDHTIYSIFDQDATTGEGLRYFQFIKSTVAATFPLYYEAKPPTLDESGNVNAINKIPSQWHQLVLVPGVRSRIRHDLGDITYQEHEAQLKEGIRLMARAEAPMRNTTAVLPGFFQTT